MISRPLIQLRNVHLFFPPRRIMGVSVGEGVWALKGIDLAIVRGDTVGLAGESGSGKTTTGLTLMGWYRPTRGEVWFEGKNMAQMSTRDLGTFRRRVQMVFQDPYESLNPRFTVRRSLDEALRAHGLGRRERDERIEEAMDYVGLRPVEHFIDRYPYQLSGGQRQRVGIARALVLRPDVLVADEPASMLDVSLRAGILRIFRRMNRDLGMTILNISHDLALLRYTCDRIAVMFDGRIVEWGSADDVVLRPAHPYTRALVAAVSIPIRGEPNVTLEAVEKDSDIRAPATVGCAYRYRCPFAVEACGRLAPPMEQVGVAHWAACLRADELASVGSGRGVPSVDGSCADASRT